MLSTLLKLLRTAHTVNVFTECDQPSHILDIIVPSKAEGFQKIKLLVTEIYFCSCFVCLLLLLLLLFIIIIIVIIMIMIMIIIIIIVVVVVVVVIIIIIVIICFLKRAFL